MPRIAKAEINSALRLAAKTIVETGGKDGRISRAEVKATLSQLPAAQRNLVDLFYKFVDKRDFKAGAQVTVEDITRAVAYAKEHMVAKYDLNNNGLAKAEIAKMSLTGKAAVELAKALKAGGSPADPLSVADLGRAVTLAAKDADFMSESDSTPAFVSGRPANASGATVENLKAAFGPMLEKFFKEGTSGMTASLDAIAFELRSPSESKAFITTLSAAAPDDDDWQEKNKAAFGALTRLLGDNLTDVRVVKLGDKDAQGNLASDHGLYSYMLIGKAKDGQLAGVQFSSVET